MMTIYDWPVINNMSVNFTATPANIKAGFVATGIFPYNRNIFVDEEFLSSSRPAPATDTAASSCSNGNIKYDESARPDTSRTHFPEAGPSKEDMSKQILPQACP
jgi:hypothetical protein